ncbi:MAG: hypothetical protein ACOZD0_02510 [Pseudomonadota bacterium]
MIEPLFAGLVLALCVVALARLALGERRRARLDAALQRVWSRLTHGLRRPRGSRRGAATSAGAQARAGVRGGGPAAPAAQAGSPTGAGLVAAWHRMRQRVALREAEKRAAREADALIRRARDGHWEGNVYRPKAFDARHKRRSEAPGRGPSDTLH